MSDEIKVRVREGSMGYYEHIRRRSGDVFTLRGYDVPCVDVRTSQIVYEGGKPKMRHISAEQLFSERWMERVESDEPERVTASPQALAAAREEISGGRRVGRSRPGSEV